ncbi:hypothetical protein ACFSOZ_23900 [Mesorhizobium newzealandense]|uniref:Uncharacterized protein n=1 Tax=Mesorhizobium newzealandense TaxID=1300302 RepID=A0ABW4UIQ7_9HYPH
MKEALSFRRHRIARAVRPQNRAGPAKVRAITPGQPLPAGRGAGPHLAATDIGAAFGAGDPCNRRVQDRIRAHAMPVHGHGLN